MSDIAAAPLPSGLPLRELALRHGLGVAAERPSLAAYLTQVWKYRHFITTYANAKVVASYGTSRLGRIWQVLTPLTNAAVYFLIFGVVLGTRQGIPNFVGYLCVGLFVFNYTQAVAQNGVQALSGNLGLIRALKFPRACLPVAATVTQLQQLLVAMVVLLGIVVVTGEPVRLEWLLILPGIFLVTVFNGGLALILARLGAKAADIRQVLPFVLRTWMYGSGVFYSVDVFAEHLPKPVAAVVQANPLVVFIEIFRSALLVETPSMLPTGQLFIMAGGWAVLVGLAGFVFFWQGEQGYGRG
ncbi:ABC transporter permease [Hamadaea sp. NPDC050747]|uniref:ABC transporter permease n=1 Tax=Hamadaea sp. NPDC050747 TaxID=3155789 RepID=UPI0033D8495F